MYFTIEKSGCSERNGLVQIRYDCYLESSDEGYSEVAVRDFTGQKYEGEVDKDGVPIDMKDYEKWIEGLPVKSQINPFCCHFRRFNPDVTYDDILLAGEEILIMSHKNLKQGNLAANTNPVFTKRVDSVGSKSKIENVMVADFKAISVASSLNVRVK